MVDIHLNPTYLHHTLMRTLAVYCQGQGNTAVQNQYSFCLLFVLTSILAMFLYKAECVRCFVMYGLSGLYAVQRAALRAFLVERSGVDSSENHQSQMFCDPSFLPDLRFFFSPSFGVTFTLLCPSHVTLHPPHPIAY
jgi:hypothetical protein